MSSGKMKVGYDMLLTRYNNLKKQWFSLQRRNDPRRLARLGKYNEPEIPAVTREMLVKQFDTIGCEIPMTPEQPFTPKPRTGGEDNDEDSA
jgi:hypothetical protein